MDNNLKVGDVIGRGLAFPINLTAQGRAEITSGIPLIRSSLKNIMCWLIGTRYFLGEYGSDLLRWVGEQNDIILQNMIEHRLVEAIGVWENRVEIINVKVARTNFDSSMTITLDYRIVNARIDDTFVYPFNSKEITT